MEKSGALNPPVFNGSFTSTSLFPNGWNPFELNCFTGGLVSALKFALGGFENRFSSTDGVVLKLVGGLNPPIAGGAFGSEDFKIGALFAGYNEKPAPDSMTLGRGTLGRGTGCATAPPIGGGRLSEMTSDSGGDSMS